MNCQGKNLKNQNIYTKNHLQHQNAQFVSTWHTQLIISADITLIAEKN